MPKEIRFEKLPAPQQQMWKHFFEAKQIDTSKGLTEAFKTFKRQALAAKVGLDAAASPTTTVIDAATYRAAVEDPSWRDHWMSPVIRRSDKKPDLRFFRPYFMVPLLDLAMPGEQEMIAEQIVGTAQGAADAGRPITHVFVLSHGWHRHLFGAISAYDRLVSRFSVLMGRGRFNPLPKDFSPLFITAHWNSDPGKDVWVDPEGRRDKAGFMQNVRELFTPNWVGGLPDDATFINDFEDVFETMSRLSAPELQSLVAARDAECLEGAAKVLKYQLRGAGIQPQNSEKISMAWRCYFEAPSKALLTDQSERPKPFMGFFNAVWTLIKFVIGAASLGIVLGAIWKLLQRDVRTQLTVFWGKYLDFIPESRGKIGPFIPPLAIIALCALLLFLCKSLRKDGITFGGRSGKKFPVIQLVSWLPLQILTLLPTLYFLIVTYLLRSGWAILVPILFPLAYNMRSGWPQHLSLGQQVIFYSPWLVLALVILDSVDNSKKVKVSGLFKEMLKTHEDQSKNARNVLTAITRWPLSWLFDSLSEDSSVKATLQPLDNQLAFFEMQRRGVNAGCEIAKFLDGLLTNEGKPTALADAGFYLAGHSFGGLVVCNAARTLNQIGSKMNLQSVCTLQGALASDWWDGQAVADPPSTDSCVVRGTIATIYSTYDFANGFYYPLANNSRMALGYVGGYQAGTAAKRRTFEEFGKGGMFTELVEPPVIPPGVGGNSPKLLNLDASRLIYQGSVAAGGGHDDVFKDDVVNLVWAALAP